MESLDQETIIKCAKYIINEIRLIPSCTIKDTLLDTETSADILDAHTREEQFTMRFNIMQSWFLRCSRTQKIKILKHLAERTHNERTIVLILNTIYSGTCKDFIYALYQGLNLNLHDIKLIDGNRSLEASVLEEVIENDLKWYLHLNNYKQFCVLLDLIHLADTAILEDIYNKFLKVLKNKPSFDIASIYSDTSDIDLSAKLSKYSFTSIESFNSIQRQQLKDPHTTEMAEVYSFLNEYITDVSKHPQYLQFDKLLKKWEAFRKAYMIKIGIHTHQTEQETKPKQKEKSKEKKKPEPKAKKQKPDKNKHKKKEKKDTTNIHLPDKIQLLPVWISKKIIASFHPNVLKHLKKVNKYWEYIIPEVQKDIKCRRELNKAMEKIKKTIPEFQEIDPNPSEPILHKKFTNVCHTAIRRHTECKELVDDNIIREVFQHYSEMKHKATHLQSFPRRFRSAFSSGAPYDVEQIISITNPTN